jgi:hypothetical protein
MFNKIKKIVMAFTATALVVDNKLQQTNNFKSEEEKVLPQQPITEKDELDLEELEFLLKVVGNADLKGHQVEMFYKLIIKLQNQYIQKTK